MIPVCHHAVNRRRPWPAILALALAGVALAPAPARAEERVARVAAPFSWMDVAGRKYDMADLSKAKATVFLFSSTQCPVANLYTPRMIALAKDYKPKGVQFFLVNSNAEDSRVAVRRYASERKFPFPAVKDEGTALADRLDAQTTPQAVILDGGGAVRYLDRIDDNPDIEKVARRDVREALDAILAGRPVPRPRTLAVGCAIFREKPVLAKPALATVTYARDVAKILNANCVVCHRKGEVGPFALETYAQARTWAKPIKEYTSRRLMPPWKPVAGHGDFHDARSLTDAEIATLAKWADAGAPQGDRKDLPPAPTFPPSDAWTLGSPDLVSQPSRPYHLEPEGKDVYRNFVLPVEFKEDRFLTGMEFKPGNRAVVHHIVLYFDPTGKSAALDGKETEPGYTVPGVGIGVLNAIWGDVWVPGNAARFLPKGVAIRIPAGAKLVMQVHYHKNGKPEVDQSQAAFYFAKEKVERVIQVFPIANYAFRLQPGSARQEVKGSVTLPFDMHLHSIFPHMHMLGRGMKVTATLPDGTKKPLIWIDDWDFNWQATYYYREALALPKGTRLDMVAVYDNSSRNPRQTANPPREVRFGEQTTDEMCFAFLGLTADDPDASLGDALQQGRLKIEAL